MPRLLLLLALLWPAVAMAQAPAAPPAVAAQSPGQVFASKSRPIPKDGLPTASSGSASLVIAPSEMGFLFTDQPELLRNFKLVGSSLSDHDETWEQPWGEYRTIRNHYRELDLTFEETNGTHRRLTIEARLFDDAVGFRYRFDRAAAKPPTLPRS